MEVPPPTQVANVTMDALGLIRSWDGEAEAMFGWASDAVVGKSVGDVLVPEASRMAHWRGLARFLATGRGPVIDQTIDVDALHRDGTLVPVALTISAQRVDEGWTFHAQIGANLPHADARA